MNRMGNGIRDDGFRLCSFLSPRKLLYSPRRSCIKSRPISAKMTILLNSSFIIESINALLVPVSRKIPAPTLDVRDCDWVAFQVLGADATFVDNHNFILYLPCPVMSLHSLNIDGRMRS